MEVEYRVVVVTTGDMEETLNALAKEQWVLHTVVVHPRLAANGPPLYSLIMEGARAQEPEPEHKPMQMKGYVNT